MNSQRGLILSVLAVIVIALIVVFAMRGNEDRTLGDAQSAQNQEQVSQNQNQAAEQQSIKDLVASGQSQQCTYEDVSGETTNKGIVYVAGGKIRGDFDIATNSQVSKGHMIIDNNMMYTWMDGMNTGFKISLSQAQNQTGGTAQTGINADKKIDYKCSSWTVDNSKFVVPTTVKFSDFSSFLPQGATSGSVNNGAEVGGGS